MSAAPRRRLACGFCTRRKVKCNKQIPCNNCVKRGTPAECERYEPGGFSTHSNVLQHPDPSDNVATFAALRNRVAELEDALQRRNVESDTAPSPPSTAEPAAVRMREQQSSPSPSQEPEIEDAVTVLEFLAWGRMKDPDKAILSPEALKTSQHENGQAETPARVLDDDSTTDLSLFPWLQLLLPSRRQVYQLVEYHNNCLLWFHGSYEPSTFSKQLDTFYRDHCGRFDSSGVDLQWVAILFSVLTGTITSAPPHESAKWGFIESEAKLLSQKWHKAAIRSLNASDYTTNHSLHSLQAITTLTNTAHILGHSNTHSVVLASAVRIAQNLGLHRLDENAHGTDIGLETSRRVWLELCTQDWFSTPFSESYSINPLHSTSLPPNNYDENMNERPGSEPTTTSFCHFLNKIAAIMPSLQDAMAVSNTLYTKYEAVLVHDKRMRSLATGRPDFLADTVLNEDWPCFIPWARRAITMSSAHKIIMIHRKFLGPSYTNSMFGFTRRTCLAASKTILREYLAYTRDESSPMLWTHQAFSVAACIIISFDLLHQTSTSGEVEIELVEQALERLRSSRQNSMIATRGVKILTALQKQIAGGTERRKLLHDGRTTAENPRKRHRGFDSGEFVRYFCGDVGVHPRPATQANSELQQQQDRPAEANSELCGSDDYVSEHRHAVDEPISVPADLNWLWNMPGNGEDGTYTLESLLSLANQDLQF